MIAILLTRSDFPFLHQGWPYKRVFLTCSCIYNNEANIINIKKIDKFSKEYFMNHVQNKKPKKREKLNLSFLPSLGFSFSVVNVIFFDNLFGKILFTFKLKKLLSLHYCSRVTQTS